MRQTDMIVRFMCDPYRFLQHGQCLLPKNNEKKSHKISEFTCEFIFTNEHSYDFTCENSHVNF